MGEGGLPRREEECEGARGGGEAPAAAAPPSGASASTAAASLDQVGYSNLWQISYNLQNLVRSIIIKLVPCHLLNHMHNVWTKATTLDGPLTNTSDLTPDKIKDTEGVSIWCHPMEKVPGVICNSALVFTLTINGLPEHFVQVPMVG